MEPEKVKDLYNNNTYSYAFKYTNASNIEFPQLQFQCSVCDS